MSGSLGEPTTIFFWRTCISETPVKKADSVGSRGDFAKWVRNFHWGRNGHSGARTCVAGRRPNGRWRSQGLTLTPALSRGREREERRLVPHGVPLARLALTPALSREREREVKNRSLEGAL